jgi:hypothetical protein
MLGIEDPGIYTGYILAILSLLACIIYGAMNWNKGIEKDESELEKDLKWEEKDEQLKSEY